jgi:hypothetical protein
MPGPHDNVAFLSYGLIAAWLILAAYVLLLSARDRKLKRELARVREMLEGQGR